MKKLNLTLTQILLVQLFLFNSIIAQNEVKNNMDTLSKTTVAEQNQIYGVDNGTLYYEKLYVTPEGQKYFSKTVKFKNLSIISFLKNGKIALINSSNKYDTTDLKYVSGLKIKTGSYIPTGILIGGLSGTFIGFIVGSIIDSKNENQWFELGKPYGAVIGLLAGALIGGITGSQINKEDFISLTNYNENQKRVKMINFIKNKN